jgi:peptidoglycan/LPS O-acetylase OafA/YrhL
LENLSTSVVAVATKKRLNALTSLRFFAASMIVIYHSLNLFGLDKCNFVSKLALDQGVSCFFVLSGFILSYAYPSLVGLQNTLRFFVARIGRIWPAHIVTGLLAIGFSQFNFWQPAGKIFPWITLANFTMTHGWILDKRSYFSFNAPSWSISTEFFFYLCFPLLIHQWNKTWKIKVISSMLLVFCCVGISVGLQSILTHTSTSTIFQRYLYINPLARIFEFVIGMLTFSIYQRIRTKDIGYSMSTLFEILAISLLVLEVILAPLLIKHCFIHPYKHSYVYWLRYCGGAPFYSFLILILAIGKGAVSNILSRPFFVKLGDMSYSIYLLHSIILSQFLLYKDELFFHSSFLNYSCYCMCVLALAYLSYTFIEIIFQRKIVSLGEKALCKIE